MIPLLGKDTALLSRELLRPLRLASLAVGIALLIAGSICQPSTDWDIPLCFVMALPTYALAPWAFRQAYYFRWRWIPLAGAALWAAVDGTYSLYWWLRGFDALAAFRPANYFYCIWLFWICGFVWNVDYAKVKIRLRPGNAEEIGRRCENRAIAAIRLLPVLFLIVLLTDAIGCLCGFFRVHVRQNEGDWMPSGFRIELNKAD